MKKLVSFLMVFILLCSLPLSINAQGNNGTPSTNTSSIVYNSDGSYMITTIESSILSRATTQTITGRKNIDLYNSSDELVWTYTIIGTFNVVMGSSSVCTNSTYSYIIYDDDWSMTAHNNYCSANVAYGTATFKRKVLFITLNTCDVNAELGCDVNGNLS